MSKGNFMKKTIFCTLLLALLTTGCTNQEQDEKIHAYWQAQLAEVLGFSTVPAAAFTPAEPLTTPAEEPALTQQEDLSVLAQAEKAPLPTVPSAAPVTSATAAPTQQDQRLRVFLFTHTHSPLCQQLKKDQWDAAFQQKYQDKILLVEYDMIDPNNRLPLSHLMRRYQLPSLTVPILFIGDTVLPGYPFTGVDEAVQKALAKQALAAKKLAQRAMQEKAAQERKKNSSQYMEIIMEDESPLKNTSASARDRRAIQQALANLQQSNQQALHDIGAMFGNETQVAAYAITSRTERLLKEKASVSPDYQTYASFQKRLLSLQEKNLNQLMRQNAGKLKALRG